MHGEERNTNSLSSNTLTPHTNADTIHIRPTLKYVEGFQNASVRGLFQEINYELTLLSELIENHILNLYQMS